MWAYLQYTHIRLGQKRDRNEFDTVNAGTFLGYTVSKDEAGSKSKEKNLNPNKAQSPLKNMNSVTQYCSSAELVKEYKIKREQLAKEHNDKIRNSQAPMTHKRKNLEESIAQQGKSILPINKSVSQSFAKEEINASHMIIGKGQIKERIQISGEKEHDIDTIDGVKVLPTNDIDEHNMRLDDPAEQEEIGEDGWLNSDDDINVDCGTNGVPQKKNVRGPITCKEIHARTLDEREVVTFDLGQAVGPTDKAVSNLSNFIGTVVRNPKFINLLYTSWHSVPDETKKCIWDYVNHWTKENNEEPLKAEMFVATRTKMGKEVQADTQIAIVTIVLLLLQSELENHQNAGKTLDDAFTAVFGKEKPGRVRGYGRSIKRTSLQKDEEMKELKQKHANEVTSMKEEIISEMRQEMR
ncbi:hypothetical protein FXO38_15314 [Capsicum annuum]|nr:hypothetical protein FXO38_15314 [Capsicum annuum]